MIPTTGNFIFARRLDHIPPKWTDEYSCTLYEFVFLWMKSICFLQGTLPRVCWWTFVSCEADRAGATALGREQSLLPSSDARREGQTEEKAKEAHTNLASNKFRCPGESWRRCLFGNNRSKFLTPRPQHLPDPPPSHVVGLCSTLPGTTAVVAGQNPHWDPVSLGSTDPKLVCNLTQ